MLVQIINDPTSSLIYSTLEKLDSSIFKSVYKHSHIHITNSRQQVKTRSTLVLTQEDINLINS